MDIKKLLAKKNMSIYKLSKLSEVPYSTVNDICNKKTGIEKCSAEKVYKLSKALNVPMEKLLDEAIFVSQYSQHRPSFELFKSSICHRVKELGDKKFIKSILESDKIRIYFDNEWYAEALYLLAMIDYLSRENNLPLCDDYDDLRKEKLAEIIYPSSIIARYAHKQDDAWKQAILNSAISEFKNFNIIESEVRDVV